MSYDIYDAWLDEKENELRWPFAQWRHYATHLREEAAYFNAFKYPSHASAISQSLQFLFGQPSTEDRLQQALEAAADCVEVAIDEAESEAYSAWMNHEVWLPVMSVSARPEESPVPFLIECIDAVGPGDDFSEMEICAGAGLWALGEWLIAFEADEQATMHWAMSQIAFAWSEAKYYAALAQAERDTKRRRTSSAQIAAQARHASNRKNKQAAEALWKSKAWKSQAEAAREIVKTFHVVQPVAERWIRGFKAKP